MNLRRFLAVSAALSCVFVIAGSTATAAGEEIVVESAPIATWAPDFGIDSAVSRTLQSRLLVNPTCLPLLEFDEVTGALGPEAAAAMPTLSADGKTYTFVVETGHAFSNAEAEPVTAMSFKRSMERATSPLMDSSIPPTPPLRGLLGLVVGAAAFFNGSASEISGIQVSGSQLTIELTQPRASFLRRAIPSFCATSASAPDVFSETPLPSAGPYYIASAPLGGPGEIVLERNPNYGGDRIQNLGRIRWVQHGSPLAEDYVADAPPAYVAPSGYRELFNPTTGIERMALNTIRPPFDNPTYRRAAALAVDRTALTAAHGNMLPTDQFMSTVVAGFQDADVYPLDGSGAAEASALLGGATPSVRLCFTAGSTPRAALTAAAETQLEAVGFVVERVGHPPDQYFTSVLQSPDNCEIALFTWIPGTVDPSESLEPTFSGAFVPPFGPNFSFFDDPGVNARLAAAETITPDTARLAEYADLDADIAEAAPAIAVGIRLRRDVFSSRIGCRHLSQFLYGYAVNRLCIEVDQTAPAGGTVSTGDEATSSAPLQTSVNVPSGGSVTITQGQATTDVPPEYELLEQQLDISAPAQTPPDFLTFTFELDAGLLAAAGLTVGEVAVLRNGAGIPDCTGAGAAPDPCIASRVTQADGDGEIVARSSQASTWEFGERYDVAGGFVAPIDNLPVVNTVSAGRTVPARFSLGGNEGLDILADGSPTSAQVACPGSAPTDAVEETSSSTGGGLSFDTATGAYQYNWKTAKSWVGTCRRLTIGLREGSQLQALFKFK